ncbi:hypothetical protein N7478_007774 [Penicillium angulare]|uniref:uncharacterized protein n=1 Tax=Penicillium angulare TaxID=116970 RepID=UPI002540C463|nr:uncharacterized protein N7478_007774 [Penicillium angulare]KAJ5272649.1 hypothetical protein N7478_007774 [Penicillium angulare]
MSLLSLIRELTIRPPGRTGNGKEPWTGISFNHLVAQKKCNAEALLAQSTGEVPPGDQACRYCQEGKGILDGCVRVPNEKFCANFHLCSAKKRCSFESDTNLAPASSYMVIAQAGKEKPSSLTLEELTQLPDQGEKGNSRGFKRKLPRYSA